MVPYNAWSLAEASEVAYKDENDVTHMVKSWGFEGVKTIGYNNNKTVEFRYTQVFVAWNDEIVLICFRGTERSSTRDWINNTDLAFTKGPFGGSIHTGFHNALHEDCEDTTVLKKLIDEVHRLGGKGRALYLTGHSLGGALATLTAAHLLERGVTVTGLYTYGSPRVGNDAFAMAFNRHARALTHRFVNHQDAVARLPLRRLGYRHVGEMWYISGDEVISNAAWWRQVWDVITFDFNGQFDLVVDHSLATGYIPSLWRALSTS